MGVNKKIDKSEVIVKDQIQSLTQEFPCKTSESPEQLLQKYQELSNHVDLLHSVLKKVVILLENEGTPLDLITGRERVMLPEMAEWK